MSIVPQDNPRVTTPKPTQNKRRRNGEGTLYQWEDKSGRLYWRAELTLGYTEEGKAVRRRFSADTKIEAARLLNRALAEKDGIYFPKPLTVSVLARACGTEEAIMDKLLLPLIDCSIPIDPKMLWRIIHAGVTNICRREARKANMITTVHGIVRDRDQMRCRYCGASVEGYRFHYDHVVPVKLGGQSTIDNLVLACPSCNQKKGARLLADVGMRLLAPGTRHPRIP